MALVGFALTASRGSAVDLQTELVLDAAPSETMFVTAPTGDAQYLYTGGRATMDIWVLDRETGQRLDSGGFLNLPNASGTQDGLLYMAFHPDYASNGLFYTYTFRSDDRFIRVTERRRSESNPLAADPDYERQILEVANPSASHNGGWLGFSPIDGYLYVTTGDGGANQGADNGLPAQDLFSPQGKLLRVDVNSDDFPEDESKNYSIPSSNPFDESEALPEIYAYGLRHPFRASFDRQTGDLYIGDVGGSYFEEINYLPAESGGGQNFGWRAFEGSADNPDVDDPAPVDAIDPIYEYPRGSGASVVGGYVYRGSEIEALDGTYFFGDFINDDFFSFRYDGTDLTEFEDRTNELFPDGIGGAVAFGEDGLGELYVIDYIRSDIHRITTAPLAGDYNDDGVVDAADYVVWRENVGNPEGTLPNDADGGVIGDAQYQTWAAEYGVTDSTGPASVPEPTALAAAALALAAAAFRRRR